jgi:hypothetical protein
VDQKLPGLTRDQVVIKEVFLEDVVLYHQDTNLPILEIILLEGHKGKIEFHQVKDHELHKDLLQIQDYMDKVTEFHQFDQVEFQMSTEELDFKGHLKELK